MPAGKVDLKRTKAAPVWLMAFGPQNRQALLMAGIFLKPGATHCKLGGSCAVEKPDVGNAQFKPAAAKR